MTKKDIERTKAEFIGKHVVVFVFKDKSGNDIVTLQDLSETKESSNYTYLYNKVVVIQDIDVFKGGVTLYFDKNKELGINYYLGDVIHLDEPNPSNLN
jgi:hypothetical protein